jgi:hypothetical protein
MLNEIATNMKRVGVEIHLARVKHEVMALLEKDGVDKNIGRDLIHSKVFEPSATQDLKFSGFPPG